jgi:hypothetical protein
LKNYPEFVKAYPVFCNCRNSGKWDTRRYLWD